MNRRVAPPLLILSALLLCAGPLAAQQPAPKPAKPAPKPLKDCTRGALPPKLPARSWQHRSSALIAQAAPGHVALDAVASIDGGGAQLQGKFAYGGVSKDLEGELVELWLSRCDSATMQYVAVSATDDDGRVSIGVAEPWLREPARYTARLRLVGDGSFVDATVWALAPGSPVIVFDIDGTLTTSDGELFRELRSDLLSSQRGAYVPTARAGAAALTQRWHKLNYPIIYLTGRPYLLADISRAWLQSGGFAPGALMLTSAAGELLPREGSVGAYKLARLNELAARGLVVHTAYGNAQTDVYAYVAAGVALARIFIVGPHGGERGTQALGDDYEAHLSALKKEQP